MRENNDINMKESYAWLQSENYSSHTEGYLLFMQEQEVNENAAKKREKKTLQKDETLTESVGCVHKGMKIYFTLFVPVRNYQIRYICTRDTTELRG